MPQFGWVKNNGNIEQSWGRHSIGPHAVGVLPIEVIETLRQRPLRELTILSDDPKQWVFKTTEHMPFSPRYRKNG